MLIFLDTETTGSGKKDRLCQIAFKTKDGKAVEELFNPRMPISIEAMAIHHITNEMVADKPKFRGSDLHRKLQLLFADPGNIMVAHNAKFDIAMLDREDIHPQQTICTYKLARHLDNEGEIPQYNLQYLRYYLKLDVQGATPHTALGDIMVLEGIFNRIYEKFKEIAKADPLAEMVRISALPVLVPRMPFGKHKGKKMSEVPMDYLQWLAGTNLDEDLAYTVQHHLTKPGQGPDYDVGL